MLKTLKLLILMVISFSFLTFCKTSGSKTSSSSPKAPTGNTAGDAPQVGPLAPVDPATDSVPQVASDLHDTMAGCVASQGQDPANVPSAEQLASEIQTNGTAAAAAAAIAAQGGTCKEGQTDNCIPADTSVGTTTENPNATVSHGHMWLFLMVPAAIATAAAAGATIRSVILYAQQVKKARAEKKLPTGEGTAFVAEEGSPRLAGTQRTATQRAAAVAAFQPEFSQSDRGRLDAFLASPRDAVVQAATDQVPAERRRAGSAPLPVSREPRAAQSVRAASAGGVPRDTSTIRAEQTAASKTELPDSLKAQEAKSKNHGKFAFVGALATAAFAGVTVFAGSQLRLADSSDPKAVCANNLDLLEARYLNLLGAQ